MYHLLAIQNLLFDAHTAISLWSNADNVSYNLVVLGGCGGEIFRDVFIDSSEDL
jgi:hypothetical protein